jgi:soluble calcium-activated nucleotidase 1
MWVKVIDDRTGSVTHVDWQKAYQTLRKATGTEHPGYLFHESCHWNPILKRWFFLPRRLSTESYKPEVDELKGANTLISLNEKFEDPKIVKIGISYQCCHYLIFSLPIVHYQRSCTRLFMF